MFNRKRKLIAKQALDLRAKQNTINALEAEQSRLVDQHRAELNEAQARLVVAEAPSWRIRIAADESRPSTQRYQWTLTAAVPKRLVHRPRFGHYAAGWSPWQMADGVTTTAEPCPVDADAKPVTGFARTARLAEKAARAAIAKRATLQATAHPVNELTIEVR